jgi:hypothetical protein
MEVMKNLSNTPANENMLASTNMSVSSNMPTNSNMPALTPLTGMHQLESNMMHTKTNWPRQSNDD